MISAAVLVFSYGVLVGKFQIFPYRIFDLAMDGFRKMKADLENELPWYYRTARDPEAPYIRNTDRACGGLNLVTEIDWNSRLLVKVMDMDGNVLQQWDLDWFQIWPDAKHVPERWRPKERPGTHIHGAVLMNNGDLIFNFEHLGIVRLNRKGKIIWRLPYQTHHSIHRQDNGNLWVCGQIEHTVRHPRFPNRIPPFDEYMILEITPDGQIVYEQSVAELLIRNGLTGLLYMSNLEDSFQRVEGDLLHLNDVEPFPLRFREGFFRKGDIMVSLRNVNTIFVYNRENNRIKFTMTGRFIRQHDPDFLDGNRFSVYDNNNLSYESDTSKSRILIVSAPDRTIERYFEGSKDFPFYTDVMGKNQWLPNGNLLITESRWGRAFEIDANKQLVWEYINHVGDGMVGLVEEVRRLPPEYASLFVSSNQDHAESHMTDP